MGNGVGRGQAGLRGGCRGVLFLLLLGWSGERLWAEEGKWVFTAPSNGKAMDVYWAKGDHTDANAKVILVMHGKGRNAKTYCKAWLSHIKDRNALVVAPHFTEEDYPGTKGYNLGNMVNAEGEALPRPQWAFSNIEPLFQFAVKQVKGRQQRFSLFGHSAGAQFVHRYLTFYPNAPVDVAIAANAGWYTLPTEGDKEYPFAYPYSMKKAPASTDLAAFLNQRLIVLLGTGDVEQDENVSDAKGAVAQGENRLQRGLWYFGRVMEAAVGAGIKSRFELHTATGLGHSQGPMAAVAATYLFP